MKALGIQRTLARLMVLCQPLDPEQLRQEGSPEYLSSQQKNDCELLLHEFCHARLLGLTSLALEDGECPIDLRLCKMPDFRSNLHEIRTIAIELLVSKKLRLNFNKYNLIHAGIKNLRGPIIRGYDGRFTFNLQQERERSRKCIEGALRTPLVKRVALQICQELQACPPELLNA